MNSKPKLTSFIKAMANLKSILTEKKTSTVRDAAIKRYELCYELAWKSVQEAHRTEGMEVCKSPKACFKQAFKQGWIADEEAFGEMVQNRNLTTHTYNEDLADEIYNNLETYLHLFESLLAKLQVLDT
jgi:nucleotidyltransferase substrate binding protein (TIGR01987 family)